MDALKELLATYQRGNLELMEKNYSVAIFGTSNTILQATGEFY